MPRKFLKRLTPSPESLKRHKGLSKIAHLMEDPYLFHLNRQSVARAFAIGLGVAMLPIFGHIFLAAILAIWRRANIVLSLTLIWLSNPVTFPFLLYIEYQFGLAILQRPDKFADANWSWDWMLSEINSLWFPLFTGGIALAVLASFIGYYTITIVWHQTVVMKWKRRKRSQRLLEIAKNGTNRPS